MKRWNGSGHTEIVIRSRDNPLAVGFGCGGPDIGHPGAELPNCGRWGVTAAKSCCADIVPLGAVRGRISWGPMGVKVSDFVASYIAEYGVRAVFEMSGGMITHLLDSLQRQGHVRIVSMHHEQGAGFAADAFGRVTGIPGVALATSGPGALNLLTGIASCYFDSVPAVFITGQVNRAELKGKRAVRQLGFQETDVVSVAGPITKAAWQAREPSEVGDLLFRAFDLAIDGRPGPVLVDIPMDVQYSIDEAPPAPHARKRTENRSLQGIVEEVLTRVRNAKRPLIVAGGGVRAAQSRQLLREFARREAIPVVNSLLAVDALSADDPLRVGMLGSYGNRWVNLAIGRADFLLVLGSRLDIRQTGADVDVWKGGRDVIHVDCDATEINNRVKGCWGIQADLADFFTLAARCEEGKRARTEWIREIQQLRGAWPDTTELRDVRGINPNVLMHQISAASSGAAGYVIDVGQHQMWAAQSLDLRAHQRFLTSGGLGSMGYGLPAAVGASIAEPNSPWVVIAGDGGFQSNIQELQTVVRGRLPLKIVILNNECHGMVRQFQETYFEGRYQSTVWGYSAPNFERIASAYGVPARTISEPGDVEEALAWLWSDSSGPSLLQVMIEQSLNVYPKIAFGRPMTEMEPFAKPLAMEGA